MEKIENKPDFAEKSTVSSDLVATELVPEPPTAPLNEDDTENLDLVRKILFGEQARATERKQASLERYIRESVDTLNRETQQELASLQKDLRMLEQQTKDWRRDILQKIEQSANQLRQEKVDRRAMADLLQGMAQQLADEETLLTEG